MNLEEASEFHVRMQATSILILALWDHKQGMHLKCAGLLTYSNCDINTFVLFWAPKVVVICYAAVED